MKGRWKLLMKWVRSGREPRAVRKYFDKHPEKRLEYYSAVWQSYIDSLKRLRQTVASMQIQGRDSLLAMHDSRIEEATRWAERLFNGQDEPESR